jgi:hypothetical protein
MPAPGEFEIRRDGAASPTSQPASGTTPCGLFQTYLANSGQWNQASRLRLDETGSTEDRCG